MKGHVGPVQDVRKAVLAALPPARGSAPLAELIERTRDVSDEVGALCK